MGIALYIAEAAVIASSLSLDSFAAGFAYGAGGTRVPRVSVLVINLICGAITGISLLLGAVLKPYLPHWLTLTVSFSVLFIIGLTKLLDSVTKSIINKYSGVKKKICLSLFNFKLVLSIYADPEKADADESKTLSPAEAGVLALSLSLDGMAVGFGAALSSVNALYVFLWSLGTNALFFISGRSAGQKIARKIPFNISWISGAALIILAIVRLL
jgi:putative sporulation protein YtaF